MIRNVFDPKEFEVAMDKILDHKEAMRSQASNFGKVKKLELYDVSVLCKCKLYDVVFYESFSILCMLILTISSSCMPIFECRG